MFPIPAPELKWQILSRKLHKYLLFKLYIFFFKKKWENLIFMGETCWCEYLILTDLNKFHLKKSSFFLNFFKKEKHCSKNRNLPAIFTEKISRCNMFLHCYLHKSLCEQLILSDSISWRSKPVSPQKIKFFWIFSKKRNTARETGIFVKLLLKK